MKRIIFWLFAGILTIQSGLAQFKLGVKMGITASNVNMQATSDFDDLELPTARSLNFDGGIVFEYDLMPDMLAIRSSLDFAQKGFNVNLDQIKEKYNDIKNISGDWSTKFQYLQLPVSLVYRLGDFNINAGPYLAYGLGGSEIQNLTVELTDGSTQNIQETYDLEPVLGSVDGDLANDASGMFIRYFNGLDFGINVGFGFNIKKVLLNVQYQQGLTNITPELTNESGFSPSDLLARHNVLSLEITYFFVNK